jgi:hypothetical protein
VAEEPVGGTKELKVEAHKPCLLAKSSSKRPTVVESYARNTGDTDDGADLPRKWFSRTARS